MSLEQESATASAPPVLLSIVVCTWNRVDMLVDTLRSISACSGDGSFNAELIVVDNASTDSTPETLERLQGELSFIHLHEPRAGLSNARNTGVERARGDWVIFLDDDVLVPDAFLVNYSRAIRTLPGVSFIAGGVIPHFDEEVPPWVDALCEEQWWCFSAMILSAPTGELTAVQTPYGANMAVRRDILRHHRFSDAYGFRHGTLIPGEETELFSQIRAAGHRGFWVDDVALLHRLPPQRRRIAYLVKRAIGQGVADAERSVGAGARFPRWILKDIVVSAVATVADGILGRRTWAASLLQLMRSIGYLRGTIRERPRPLSTASAEA